MRSRKNKLVVKFNNLKSDSLKEIKRLENKIAVLQDQLKHEKDKRVDVQLQKIEQSSALYETINEKASKINRLKQQLNDIESEKDELQSLGQTYLGLGPRLSVDREEYKSAIPSIYKTGGREVEPSVYQSQQLYNLKGLHKGSKRHTNRSMSAKRNSTNGSLSLKSMNRVKMEGFRKQLMDNDQDQGPQTQRGPSPEDNKRTLSRYMTERPCLEMNVPGDFNPVSLDVQSPHHNHKIGQQVLRNISSLQAISQQEQMILQ